MLDCLQSNITRPHQVLLEVGYGNFFSSPGVNDHHARVVRGGDGQGEGGGAPGGGVWKFFTSFNEETRSTARCAPLICPRLDLYHICLSLNYNLHCFRSEEELTPIDVEEIL